MDCFANTAKSNSDFDVEKWTNQWLENGGMNTLKCTNIEYLEDNKCKITIEQGVCLKEFPTLR